MKVTECLNAEHDVFLAQLDRLDFANGQPDLYEPAALAGMVELLRVAVDRHAHFEEGGLYKALEPHLGADRGPLAVMDSEHAEIRKTTQEIAKWKPDQPRIELHNNIAHFSQTLRFHITKEIQVLFPMAEKLLGDKELTRMADECACAKRF